MAGWQRMAIHAHQSFAEAIFAARQIGCEVVFCYLPHIEKWEAWFKTKFRYLSINEKHEVSLKFNENYDCFVDEMERLREMFEREYNYYFNEIWC